MYSLMNIIEFIHLFDDSLFLIDTNLTVSKIKLD